MNNSIVPPAESALSAGVIARLNDFFVSFLALLQARNNALVLQSQATTDTVVKKIAARTILSHFFQVFNMGITRGVFAASQRGYFGIDINSSVVPDMGSEDKIISVGDDVITGDAVRVANGGAAMYLPATAQVTAAVNAFRDANVDQNNKKIAFNVAQEAVAAMRSEVDSLILRMWNEIETYYSEEGPSSMRMKAREWGVVYSEDVAEYSLEGQVTDLSGVVLPQAEVMLVQTGTKVYSDENGLYKVPAVAAGSYDVQVSKQHYHTQTVPQVQIVHGETTSLDIQLLAMPGALQATVYSEGLPLPEATVSIEALGLSGQTGVDGTVHFPNVSAGSYNVEAVHPGKQPMILPVTINPDQTATLTFDLNNE